MARVRAGQVHALGSGDGPAAHHRERDLRMELKAVSRPAEAKGLGLEILSLGEQRRPAGEFETLAMPLIDLAREGAVAEAVPMLRRLDRVIADFHAALRVRSDAATEMTCQHLGAEADAEQRLFLPERNPEPVHLAAQPGVFVVRAHRAAEDDDPGVLAESLWKRIAEPGPPDVEPVPLREQQRAEPSRRRMFLVKDDQNPAAGFSSLSHRLQE